MRHAHLVSTGAYVPELEVTNAELKDRLEAENPGFVDKVAASSGIGTRWYAPDDWATSDLAVQAGREALERASVEPKDVDLIIVGTDSPDYITPSTSVVVQEKLGAKNAGTFDVGCACASFPTAVANAAGLIALNPSINNVLVIGAYMMHKLADPNDAMIFFYGDGAGAAVLRPREDCGQGEILGHTLGADGEGYSFIHIPEGGAAHPHNHPDYVRSNHFIRVKGREVYRFAVTKMTELIRAAAEPFGPDEVKVVIPHQVNMRIIAAARERLDWPIEKFFLNIEKYGNTSAGSVPIALDEAVRTGQIKTGDVVILVAFGAGLTWGCTTIRW